MKNKRLLWYCYQNKSAVSYKKSTALKAACPLSRMAHNGGVMLILSVLNFFGLETV